MVEQLYVDAFERAKKVADMDSKERKNAIWDLAEEFKVTNMINLSKFGTLHVYLCL